MELWWIADIPCIYTTGNDLSLPFEVTSTLQGKYCTVKCRENAMHADAAPTSVLQRCSLLRDAARANVLQPVYPPFIDSFPSCSEVNKSNPLFSNTAWKDTSQFPVFPARAQGCNITLRSIYNVCVCVTLAKEQVGEHSGCVAFCDELTAYFAVQLFCNVRVLFIHTEPEQILVHLSE